MSVTFDCTRRGLFRAALGVGAAAGSMSGWLRALASEAPKKPVKSVIVLWLNGGPATIDLWDLKPGHENGGSFKEINTTAPGMKIGEHLPNLAKHGKELALVRSMKTKEGDHGRAAFLLRTGYTPQGAVQFPAVGAVLAKELGSESTDLPNFVSMAPARYAIELGGGFLGPHFDPLVVGDQAAPQDGLKVPDLGRVHGVTDAAQKARLELLAGVENRFVAGRNSSVAASVQAAASRAVRLMKPEAAAAFDLDQEKQKTRDAYGRGLFGQGCLLARRLVERGVPFVEVTLDGWDTHQNNFDRVKELCGTLDAGFASLVNDLKDRGLLDSTLVVCQGEFGRTPKINAQTGRDHWPASWAVALAGGGLKTGQAIGNTTKDGLAVEEQPVSVPDLIATVAKAVGIDPQKQNMSNVGRPIRVADPDAKPIKELL
ncbi:hypothetical protein VT84_25640 [Gemmata sp. SH-PL17]|uniref:DUF1501 domain-containing protein n=1 Tax=Gemmata sp. SH-PL17 TaxID=1630693 RepID=UPI0004BA66EC|nr:DUF1501 domain-containing protein [Gemmata sp. SH-PL17]AMV27811.1 hypothetical protein VT84_25640 [Gemmata sp. SH-PL17]